VSGVPYLAVMKLACRGLAASAAGDFAPAAAHFIAALAKAREIRAGLEFEARFLSLLADTYARAGNHSLALDTAKEALSSARGRNDRISECLANIVAAESTIAGGHPDNHFGANSYLAEAERLLDVTGAGILRPMLGRVRAKVKDTSSESV
jgi:tetratricopeptide (TPR) repeat protein